MNSTVINTGIGDLPAAVIVGDYNSILQQRLSEKIKSGFIELIPEEQFDKMIAAAMEDLQLGPRRHRYKREYVYMEKNDPRNDMGYAGRVETEVEYIDEKYNVLHDINTIPGMIYASLHKSATEAINQTLNTPEYQGIFKNDGSGGKEIIDGALSKIIGDNVDLFVKKMFGGIISAAMHETLMVIRNSQQNGRPLGY